MKSVAIAAGFAATLAAAHAGHGHQHAHNKRGADGVFTSWDITTEWEYVTVTAGQAGPAGTEHAQAPAGSHSAAAPSAVQSQATSAAQGGNDVSAAAVTSAPASGGASDPNAIQASINSAKAASNSAYQASMLSLQAAKNSGQGQSVPAQNTAAPSAVAPSSSAVVASSSAAKASSTGGSTGGGPTGQCTETYMTYYSGAGGLGSCGDPVIDSNPTVAMPPNFMKAKCGSKIKIYVDGDSTGHEATVTDTCPGCTDGHVDVAQDWAFSIAGQAKLVAAGKLPIKYCWE